MIHVSVSGTEQIAQAFTRAGSRVRERVDHTVIDQAEAFRSYVIHAELSGQMLAVRTGKRRTQMTYKIRRTEKTIAADIHPTQDSVLWMLGKGMAPKKIAVSRRSSRVQRRAARAFGRGYRKRLRRMVGSYYRTHRLRKVPFMEAAFFAHRQGIRGAIETAVTGAVDEARPAFAGGEGI